VSSIFFLQMHCNANLAETDKLKEDESAWKVKASQELEQQAALLEIERGRAIQGLV
jgi:hypothetical protein